MEQTNRFLGAKSYIVLNDPSGTYIGHIDCWGKFLSSDTVLIARVEDEKTNKSYDIISDFLA